MVSLVVCVNSQVLGVTIWVIEGVWLVPRPLIGPRQPGQGIFWLVLAEKGDC